MDPNEIIRKFAQARSDLPKEEMTWARYHWEDCAPTFLALLQRFADSEERPRNEAEALFFVLFLMGEKRETRAFPLLCRLARHPTALGKILGDGVTEALTNILIGTFDGNVDLLKGVIETDRADCFVRETFLQTLTWATVHGHISPTETSAYLVELFERLLPRTEDYVWVGWQDAISTLGFEHLAPLVATAFERGWIDDSVLRHSDFLGDLAVGATTTDRAALLRKKDIAPFEDVIAELSSWYGFSSQYKLNREKWAKEEAEVYKAAYLSPNYEFNPYVNPFRDVGRNDPCPCGSGKKFKKCCLGKDQNEAA